MAARGSTGGFLTVAAGLVAVGYFLVHGLTGEAGLAAWTETRREIAALEARHVWLALQVADLEDRARRLRETTLDLDYLEERARDVAMVGRPDEVVIPSTALDAALAGGPRAAWTGSEPGSGAARRWGERGVGADPNATALGDGPRASDTPVGDRAYTMRLVAQP